MLKYDGLSHSLTAFDQDSTLVVVVELAASSWTVGALVPGVTRQPTKKMAADKFALARQLEDWREQAEAAVIRSSASAFRWKPGGMAFGWPAGCWSATLKLM